MKISSGSVEETLKLGRRIASSLAGGEIILLSGPLGAGKTVLAKGIAQGLAVDKNEVLSPTFVLLRVYRGKMTLQHFDFYRIKNPAEIAALGYYDYLYDNAVTVIEWPERLKSLAPEEFLRISIVPGVKNRRVFKFAAKGVRYKKIAEKINENTGDRHHH
ncbi:MAG: tRNA (adenosine(37)-N6)-threonylcarbamoyltransferase complex ATPase subunit type 1 TsaE [Candidatus Omnitrophica bacterium]|nr:tRNA (adenosine(37)-N6)-threonylcarbamoyltransferase complex ATPase subunit type 1 TsaE [Candidatus Omnitrophota bacterium]MDD5725055.1 tRNA (adenosine(37)-N6)-threonylcarbamoyltransferase complex ATPase subunit type 1 TsaE [Candidatus Omnitrophota bacterium]